MARHNKFASVNLNDSYGKADRGGSANNSSNGASSASGKPRVSSSGGMIVLSRPTRTQPPSPPPKLGQTRLAIPTPVNLPSMKREIFSGDPPPDNPPVTGWSRAESPSLRPGPSDEPASQQKAALGRSLDTVEEGLKAMSDGKTEVYAPPVMRAAMQTTSVTRLCPPTPPYLEKASPVIRGEEFPTLQAAVARPPTPPYHPRQKDLQQKQRERHHDAKEQRLKLHQLSQLQGHKQCQIDSLQCGNGNLQSQSPTLSLRPLGRPESVYQKVRIPSPGSPSPPTQGSNAYLDYLSGFSSTRNSSPNLNTISSDSGTLRASRDAPNDGNFSRVDDARESGPSFRPQYGGHSSIRNNSFNFKACEPGLQVSMANSLCLPSSRRDFVPSSWDMEHSKYPGELQRDDADYKLGAVLESEVLTRDSYFSKDSLLDPDGNIVTGIIRAGPLTDHGGLARGSTDPFLPGPSTGEVPDVIPCVQGFYSHHPFARTMHIRDVSDEKSALVETECYNRDNGDVYDVDARDSRKNLMIDSNQDLKEVCCQFSRNVLDCTEACSHDPALIKQLGHGYPSATFGDSSWRRHISGRTAVDPAGISSIQNPGPVYDTQLGKRHFQGAGDQGLAGVECASTSLNDYTCTPLEQPNLFGSNPQVSVSSRVRRPVFGNRSYEMVNESNEILPDRLGRLILGHREVSHEGKTMDPKEGNSKSHRLGVHIQRPVANQVWTQGYALESSLISSNKKSNDERSHREGVNRQLACKDERRKQAAKLKLIELEERAARRDADKIKEEILVKSKKLLTDSFTQKQIKMEPSRMSAGYDTDGLAAFQHRDSNLRQGEANYCSKFDCPRPLAAFTVPLGTLKNPIEGAIPHREPDSSLFSDGELNQDWKGLQPQLPNSWRKEGGSRPTSKLFSSPYIESGVFRRSSNGGTYKVKAHLSGPPSV